MYYLYVCVFFSLLTISDDLCTVTDTLHYRKHCTTVSTVISVIGK